MPCRNGQNVAICQGEELLFSDFPPFEAYRVWPPAGVENSAKKCPLGIRDYDLVSGASSSRDSDGQCNQTTFDPETFDLENSTLLFDLISSPALWLKRGALSSLS